MYAIIETGGKQFKVSEGDIIDVELLHVEAESNYTLDKVLLISNNDDCNVGAPYINGATVSAKVLSHGKAKKVIVYKYKAKKTFHKKKGHRQPFTQLQIEKINAV